MHDVKRMFRAAGAGRLRWMMNDLDESESPELRLHPTIRHLSVFNEPDPLDFCLRENSLLRIEMTPLLWCTA